MAQPLLIRHPLMVDQPPAEQLRRFQSWVKDSVIESTERSRQAFGAFVFGAVALAYGMVTWTPVALVVAVLTFAAQIGLTKLSQSMEHDDKDDV